MNKYFLYDPENGFETFETKDEQWKAAEEVIEGYLDDEWDEEVEDIVCGIITRKSTKCEIMKKPKIIDSNGYDEAGWHWPKGMKYRYNYEMRNIEVS